jgi:uncharacterized protein involved in response to NO
MPNAKLRDYEGPALFSYGFRPFFLLAAIYAAAMIPLWLGVFEGKLELATAFAPRDWHVREMLFGFVAAILGGFLLTAVPNWTGRLPLQCLYAAVIAATVMRICAAIEPAHMQTLLALAGAGWTLAFLGFAALYGRALCTPRPA